jgi:N-methylhydantoinase A
MAIDLEKAEAAMQPLARAAGLTVTGLAWGIHDLVNENMANAARVHLAEHGKDPRRYALLATGGAGPVHAYYVAKKLGLGRLIVPFAAGVASALGLLLAPARADRVATVARTLDEIDWVDLEVTFQRLETEAMAVLTATLPDAGSATKLRFADIRYVGQASELVVPLPPGPYTSASRVLLSHAFEKSYVDAFTRTPPTTHVEIINVRVSASIAVTDQEPSAWARPHAGTHAVKAKRPVYFPEFQDFHATTVYDRYALMPGQIFDGPAIVEERESTLVIGPGGKFAQLPSGNISVTIA